VAIPRRRHVKPSSQRSSTNNSSTARRRNDGRFAFSTGAAFAGLTLDFLHGSRATLLDAIRFEHSVVEA
jgi:hypothetical protein